MDMTENIDLIIKVGRVPYKVDFLKDDYTSSLESNFRKVVPVDQANAWSSYSRLARNEGYHLPVFDVDRPFNTMWTGWDPLHEHSTRAGSQTFQQVITSLFPEAETRWVPSTTDGHYHVYMDYPILWDQYLARLSMLKDYGIVERGYYNMAEKRKATFVRMPGVSKEPKETFVPPLQDALKWLTYDPYLPKPIMQAEWGIDIGSEDEWKRYALNNLQLLPEARIPLTHITEA